ncbi:MAG: transcription-repair coupling factor [Rhodoblastus sp.]|nr:transcription-repair coupling factor [Rhodoblastus sp.]
MANDLQRALKELERGGKVLLSRTPDGFDAFVAADIARALAAKAEGRAVALVHVARDGQRSRAFQDAFAFAAPDIEILDFPSWDCQPYDRVSPNAGITARRMTALSRLARSGGSEERPRILCTTVNALVQRVAPIQTIATDTFSAAPGNVVKTDELIRWLEINGFLRSSTVRETGEYAMRGGIVDLFAPGMPQPIRLDFFGDTLETIRPFDPETQRSTGQLRALDLVPMSEVQLTTDTMRRFRQAYLAQFGAETRGDTLYEAVSEGRRHPGMEHWLPLFHEQMDTLFDYVAGAPFVLDPLAEDAAAERLAQAQDYFEARREAYDADPKAASYKPLQPDALYLKPEEFRARLDAAPSMRVSPFAVPDSPHAMTVDLGAGVGRSFAPERADENANVFEAAVKHIEVLHDSGKRVILAGWSDGSRERLGHVLQEHGLKKIEPVSSLAQTIGLKGVALAVIGLEQGFVAGDLAIIGEQDILGDRLVRARKRQKRENVLHEVGALTAGDLVVHVDHGIGRFVGLTQIQAIGVPHDCLELHYAGGDKLYLPVENLELLSRYGSEDEEAQLDRLGGVGWQTRKARMKKRIREIAHGLIKLAAQRMLRKAPVMTPPSGLYDEFCAKFPYDETEDQDAAIEATLDDMAAGRPMDRLICGDVGFGKTEVALRAAFTGVMAGKQVAVVVPTTLLARQHYKTFVQRFAGLPVKVAQMSRMVASADLKAAKTGAASGEVDIVVGTHAVLGKTVSFKDLGLVVIDEEQHFGVGHKERLKELRAEVHVLTLSATPIPRTLQLALTGVRELSIIATPPVDRLAVRTFITPFDELIVREALLRERYRGGQSFYVCPRIEDLDEAAAFLRQNIPEAKFTIAHGQMSATELEEKMSAFYDGKYDILVSTAIVESGLDIPTANTMIVHRADMFGLGQLYQLRGRVGRSKTRAYALFTVPAKRQMTPQAEKRLKVLQSLDTLGAGFQLASHDLDIRGAGNLLGDEQSGHIKEVGYELYQQMLTDAIEALKAGEEEPAEELWSPTITVGAPVTIPETYVEDLQLRLQLYRRLSSIVDEAEIESFAAEMIDRFGPLPPEVEQLMEIVAIKALARQAHVEKVEAGPKGIIVAFRDNSFANPAGLVRFVAEQGNRAKVRPDMKIVFTGDFDETHERLEASRRLLRTLVALAQKKAA